MIPEYSEVRIVRIAGEAATRVVTSSYTPPQIPKVGDTAIVVDAPGTGTYVLEAAESDGRARWVAWFHENELELL
jgi:hypothetical protein